MVEKFIVLLGLFLMVVTVTAESNSMTNECINFTQPYNCSNDPIITVNITSKNYILEVRASLCHDAYDYCIPDYKITYRGTCNNICQFCNRSLRLQACGSEVNSCMERVDEHLNNLCSNKISVVTLFNITNTTTTETQPCPTSTNGISMTDTSKITNTCVPSCSTTTQLQTTVYAPTTRPMERQSLAKPALPILVLGALLALSILLLVIVITGWVHTCVTMKMNRVKNSCAKSRSTDDTDEKCFENPTYDGTSMTRPLTGTSRSGPIGYKLPIADIKPQTFPRATYAMYDAVNTTPPKAAGKGQTYDALDRGKVNGKQRNVRTRQGDKGYSQLGLPDNDVDNNYHLISKEND